MVNLYGLTVAVDILNVHRKEVAHLTEHKAKCISEVWEMIVKRDLLKFASVEIEPQEQSQR
jgi:hypothetical protein